MEPSKPLRGVAGAPAPSHGEPATQEGKLEGNSALSSRASSFVSKSNPQGDKLYAQNTLRVKSATERKPARPSPSSHHHPP